MKNMNDLVLAGIKRACEIWSEKYDFSKEEALSLLDIDIVAVSSVSSVSSEVREIGKNVKVSSGSKEMSKSTPKSSKALKSSLPLPFSGEMLEGMCVALNDRMGLYIQCESPKVSGCEFCNKHRQQAEESGGVPLHGTIEQRMAVDAFEYVAPHGRKPVQYLTVMKKMNLSVEDVKAEANRLNRVVDERHFEEKFVSKKGEKDSSEKQKGRPKKEKKVVEISDSDDLFASLASSTVVDDSQSQLSENEGMSAAEKETKKYDKDAKKEQEKEEKRLEKEAKKAKEEEEKESKRLEKEAKEKKEKEAKSSVKPVIKEEEEEEEEEIELTKKKYDGKEYYVSLKTGVVYDKETYDTDEELKVIGSWDAANKKVKLIVESDDEEESDEELEELGVETYDN
jgi:hypothetical protein